jgi:hypothetical protein
MSLTLLLPAALAGLVALLLPLALHLQRRRQQPQQVTFAALRWLAPSARPQRRLRLREPWLLLLRCLLVIAVVLLLAQPLLGGLAPATPWHVVVPGVDPATIDWSTRRGERRWLAPGFPSLDAPAPPAAATASLLRELDARLPAAAPLSIYLPPIVDGLDGAALTLSRAPEWIVIDAPAPVEAAARVPLQVAVAADSDHPGMRYLQAARQALPTTAGIALTDARLDPAAAPPAGIDVVLWLDPSPLVPPLRDWLAAGGRVLAFAADAPDDDDGVVLWQGRGGAMLRGARLGRGELRLLDCPLQPACLPELLDAGFPGLLARWIDDPPPLPARALAREVAPRPQPQALALPTPRQPLAPWLALLVAALWLAERWVASGRRRA